MNDPSVRWLVVTADRETVDRYLWSFAHRIATVNEGAGDVSLVLVADHRGGADDCSQMQADRLRSGLYPVLQAETYAEAHGMLAAMLKVAMERAEAAL